METQTQPQSNIQGTGARRGRKPKNQTLQQGATATEQASGHTSISGQETGQSSGTTKKRTRGPNKRTQQASSATNIGQGQGMNLNFTPVQSKALFDYWTAYGNLCSAGLGNFIPRR
jgi:hypothetical protein